MDVILHQQAAVVISNLKHSPSGSVVRAGDLEAVYGRHGVPIHVGLQVKQLVDVTQRGVVVDQGPEQVPEGLLILAAAAELRNCDAWKAGRAPGLLEERLSAVG